jgi:hypothetical protein
MRPSLTVTTPSRIGGLAIGKIQLALYVTMKLKTRHAELKQRLRVKLWPNSFRVSGSPRLDST